MLCVFFSMRFESRRCKDCTSSHADARFFFEDSGLLMSYNNTLRLNLGYQHSSLFGVVERTICESMDITNFQQHASATSH